MHLSTLRSTQRILLGVLALITLGLTLGGLASWRLAIELQSLESTLANTETFLEIERQIQGELSFPVGDRDTERSQQVQTDTRRLLDLVREENSQTATTRAQIAAVQSRIRQILILEAGMILLFLAAAAFFWKQMIWPLNRVVHALPRLLDPGGVLRRDQPAWSEMDGLSAQEVADRIELSLKERGAEDGAPQAEAGAIARELLQEQLDLSLAEKKIVASELAASIAHDIRNPLAAIQMGLSNLRADIEDEELAERAERISAEVIRLSEIVTQSVESTRMEAELPSLISLSEVTDEIIRFVSFRIPTTVTIVNRIPGDLRCRLPEERLRQALLNLILNSAATIGDDAGSITIETGTEGNDLLLSVTDDGPGLDEDILKTGGRPLTSANMGSQHFRLAVARRITRDAGGNMKLSNQPAEEGQHGTRVVLLLPSCVDDG